MTSEQSSYSAMLHIAGIDSAPESVPSDSGIPNRRTNSVYSKTIEFRQIPELPELRAIPEFDQIPGIPESVGIPCNSVLTQFPEFRTGIRYW